MKTTITRRIEWDAAHRILRHESKCRSVHGHRYVALLTVTAPKLDAQDRVIDFSVLKERVGSWVDDRWDHTTLVNQADTELLLFTSAQALNGNKKPFAFDGEPTAESIAAVLYGVAVALLADTGIIVDSVEVFETPNCSAKVDRVNLGDVHARFDTGGGEV